ncbi:hypothetical protein Tco_0923991 [Tanacetum coccineum]|uniref:Integrase, catalytic region, zinc finger, CCHC-type, peptidase aspartic, catalytic n=1 Tax=Tanacetum coccineum TaxID=301880 RepID=A0ABQ5D5A7_9ASTR
MTTLAEHIIDARVENRPPMLEKSMYDSWASRIRLFIKGEKHGRMMLDLIDNDDCDVQATNIILHGLLPDVYALVNYQEAAKDIWDRVKMLMKGTKLSYQEREDPIECINKGMAFLSAIASRFPSSNNQIRTSSNPINQATIQDGRVTVQQVQRRQHQSYAGTGNRGITTTSKGNVAVGPSRVVKCYNCQGERHIARQSEAQEVGQILDEEQLAFLADPGISEAPVAHQIIPQNSAFQTDDLDAYDLDWDDLSSAKAVLMADILSCDLEVLSEVPYFDSYPNDMINQDVQEIQYSEQTHVDDFKDKEIHSDLNQREKLIDSQLDDLIRDRNAKLSAFQQGIDTLKETLSNNVKEKESLSKKLIVFKTESNYIDKEIVLEKQNKELENIICKMYRSTQAMHMLTKPQVFYDDTHKQALGYQNMFYLKKAQRIQPILYDGSVIAKEHAVISVNDDEETLILEEKSRSKMIDKQNDPISIE